MTPAWRGVALVSLVSLVAVVLAGCGNDPGPSSASGAGADVERPEAAFDADISDSGRTLRITYTWTNESDERLLVVDRPGVQAGAAVEYDRRAAYVVGVGGTAQVSQRVFGLPEDAPEYESLQPVGVTPVPPGDQVASTIELPLPLATRTPFPGVHDAGESDLDGSEQEVEFCLGVLVPPYDPVLTSREDGVLVSYHGSTETQALYCSEREPLPS